MYELIPVTPHCYYIQSPAKIGLVELGQGEVCLIDSGNDKDAGRQGAPGAGRQRLEADVPSTTPIPTPTTSAATSTLQGQTGCAIYAPGIDCAFTRHPVLEPSFLYGGYPTQGTAAQISDGTGQRRPGADVGRVCRRGWQSIPLPGHFFDMVGFRTPGGCGVPGGLPVQQGDTGEVPASASSMMWPPIWTRWSG